jgi:hypothetical protein
MNVACPHCQLLLECTPAIAGQQVACPRCSQLLQMPVVAAPFRASSVPAKPRSSGNGIFVVMTGLFCVAFLGCCGFLANIVANKPPQSPGIRPDHPGVLSSINTIALTRVVERLPDYKPLDAAFQEPRDSKTVWLGGERYQTTGTVRSEGKKSHSFIAESTCKPSDYPTFTRIVIDGK